MNMYENRFRNRLLLQCAALVDYMEKEFKVFPSGTELGVMVINMMRYTEESNFDKLQEEYEVILDRLVELVLKKKGEGNE